MKNHSPRLQFLNRELSWRSWLILWVTTACLRTLAQSYVFDHGGADWTPPAGQQIYGHHRNVRNFIVPAGMVVPVAAVGTVDGGGWLIVDCEKAFIDGRIDGSYRGFAGGSGGGGGGGADQDRPGAGGEAGVRNVRNPAPAAAAGRGGGATTGGAGGAGARGNVTAGLRGSGGDGGDGGTTGSGSPGGSGGHARAGLYNASGPGGVDVWALGVFDDGNTFGSLIGNGGGGGGGGGGGDSLGTNSGGGGGGGGGAGGPGGTLIQIRARLDVVVGATGSITSKGGRGGAGQDGANGTAYTGTSASSRGGAGGDGGSADRRGDGSPGDGGNGATDTVGDLRGTSSGPGARGGSGGTGAGGAIRLRGLRSVTIGGGGVDVSTGVNVASDGVIYVETSNYAQPGPVLGRLYARPASEIPAYAQPIITPGSGQYGNAIQVSISAESGAIVRYSTNGSVPNENSPIYTGPFLLSQPSTVQAFAYGNDKGPSVVARADYSFRVIAPTVVRSPLPDPQTGLYSEGPVTVTYTHPGVPAGVVVRYTTNGSAVTPSSPVAPTPFVVERNLNLRYAAFAPGWIPSDEIVSRVEFRVEPPVLRLVGGEILTNGYFSSAAMDVIASSTTPGAAIRYTIDRTSPENTSQLALDGRIPVSQTVTLVARGFREGWTPSESTQPLTVNIGAGSVTFSPASGFASNAPYRVTLTVPGRPNARVLYTLLGTDQAPDIDVGSANWAEYTDWSQFANFLANSNSPTRGLWKLATNGAGVLIRASPTRIRAVAVEPGFAPSTVPASAEFRNDAGSITMGSMITPPAGALLAAGEFLPRYNRISFTNAFAAASGLPATNRVFTYSRFATVFDSRVAGGVRGVFAVAETPQGTSDRILWSFPNLSDEGESNIPIEFEYHVTPTPAETVAVIYHSDHPSQYVAQKLAVDLSRIGWAQVHYNSTIPGAFPGRSREDSEVVWVDSLSSMLRSSGDLSGDVSGRGRFVLEMKASRDRDFIAMRVVEVRPYDLDPPENERHVSLGDEMLPAGEEAPNGARPDRMGVPPMVTFGLGDNQTIPGGADPEARLVYQHNAPSEPTHGRIFAVRANATPQRMEVVWRRRDPAMNAEVFWPYQLRRYTADWPANPQRFVRAQPADFRGEQVQFPTNHQFRVVLEPFMVNPGHAFLDGNSFDAVAPGMSLLRYQLRVPRPGFPGLTQDWVGYQVVETVWRTDSRVRTPQEPIPAAIGREITLPDAPLPLLSPGYIHVPVSRAWQGGSILPCDGSSAEGCVPADRYDEFIYGSFDQSLQAYRPNPDSTWQIFPVNEGQLEVWWHNLYRGNGWPEAANIAWPSMARMYSAAWPADAIPYTIGAAGEQNERAEVDEVHELNANVYVQNNLELRGFNPNDEHAFLWTGSAGGKRLFALRDDLGQPYFPEGSKPYSLLRFRVGPKLDTETDADVKRKPWAMRVFRVARGGFDLSGEAGNPLLAPPPFPSLLESKEFATIERIPVSGPYYKDRNTTVWAKAAGDDGISTDTIVMRYRYRIAKPELGFHLPSGYRVNGQPVNPLTDYLAWLDGSPSNMTAPRGTPIDVPYVIRWPFLPDPLYLNESLADAKRKLGAISGSNSVAIVYQQQQTQLGPIAVLYDPFSVRTQPNVSNEWASSARRISEGLGYEYFSEITPSLQSRLRYNTLLNELQLSGEFRPLTLTDGEPYAILPNVLSARDATNLLAIAANAGLKTAFRQLTNRFSEPIILGSTNSNATRKPVLSTGLKTSRSGFITLAFNDHPNVPNDQPVDLRVLRVTNVFSRGVLFRIYGQDPFDEKITVRHSGDFMGNVDDFEFQWEYTAGTLYDDYKTNLNTWAAAPEPMSIPEAARWLPVGTARGLNEVSFSGANQFLLGDFWVRCRYRRLGGDWQENWTEALFVPGWVKRVVLGINQFNLGLVSMGMGKRFRSYYDYTNSQPVYSTIAVAGPRYSGDLQLNLAQARTNGLIRIYETVLRRARAFTIDAVGASSSGPANMALMLISTRLAELYGHLANEAYADAIDPTVGINANFQQFGQDAGSVFCFKGLVPSQLEEELILLRGRDRIEGQPVYNRVPWNMTTRQEGQAAYVDTYAINDVNNDGTINEQDARVAYPQGHGDGWGHALQATKYYYEILRNPAFTWVNALEAVPLGDGSVTIDFQEEERFAKLAGIKARIGSEVVALTHRQYYLEDPEEQSKGYYDNKPERAWGVGESAVRHGLGAYMDWITANAVLPEEDLDPRRRDPSQKVDRRHVLTLPEIASAYRQIERAVEIADLGLNPLGVPAGVVPYDLAVPETSAKQEVSFFDQTARKAENAWVNAKVVFEYARNASEELRKQADNEAEFLKMVRKEEQQFRSQLIEIFGYPYPDDIPSRGGVYDENYVMSGPDLVHHMYLDPSPITQQARYTEREVRVNLRDDGIAAYGRSLRGVEFNMYPEAFGMVRPARWTRSRKAPGELQLSLSDFRQAYGRLQRTVIDYANILEQIQAQEGVISRQIIANQASVNAIDQEVAIMVATAGRVSNLNDVIAESREKLLKYQSIASWANIISTAVAEALNVRIIKGTTGATVDTDITSPVRSVIRVLGTVVGQMYQDKASRQQLNELDAQQTKEEVQSASGYKIRSLYRGVEVERGSVAEASANAQLQQLLGQRRSIEMEILNLEESLEQSAGRYMAALARGERLLEQIYQFRNETAAAVEKARYRDLLFRVLRSEGIQRYRAQYDLAGTYTYIAAKAFDYETGLTGRDKGARFLERIVRARTLGSTLQGGLVGDGENPTLSAAIAAMRTDYTNQVSNYRLFTGSIRQTRISLRKELLRIPLDEPGDAVWREALQKVRVSNLTGLPEFVRHCRFEALGSAEPGLIIEFGTVLRSGLNVFGRPIEAGDNTFPSGLRAVRVRGAGVGLSGYELGMGSATPTCYLIAIGDDFMRSPDQPDVVRTFRVMDVLIPFPRFVTDSDTRREDFVPLADSLLNPSDFLAVRRASPFRMYHTASPWGIDVRQQPARHLFGRSVWNSRWMLFIPGRAILADPEEGLNRLILGVPGAGGIRVGGISDIELLLETDEQTGI